MNGIPNAININGIQLLDLAPNVPTVMTIPFPPYPLKILLGGQHLQLVKLGGLHQDRLGPGLAPQIFALAIVLLVLFSPATLVEITALVTTDLLPLDR